MNELHTYPIHQALEMTQDIPVIFNILLDYRDDEIEMVELGVVDGEIVARPVFTKDSPTVSSVHVPSTDWNKDEKIIVKAYDDEKRYTLSPWYVPQSVDAHGEWADRDEIQEAFWDYLALDNRDIRLQHNLDIVAGHWVEGCTWPHEVTVPVKHPDGEVEYTFPAGTPFLGVIWEPWAWELIKNGDLRGLSIGGKAERIEADMDEEVEYVPMGKVDFSKMISREDGKYVVYSEDGEREFGTYDSLDEAEERLRQIEYFSNVNKENFRVDDFVSWNSSGGRARGQIERIETEGSINVPDSDFTINADEDNPAALIRVWRRTSEGWEPTDRMVGHRISALAPIMSLSKQFAKQDSYTPPKGVQENAKRALQWIKDGKAGSGFTDVGRRRATQLANGQNVSTRTLARMKSYLSRHQSDKRAVGFDYGEKNFPSPGRVAYDAWGGEEGLRWASSILDRLEKHLEGKHDQAAHGKKMPKIVDDVAPSQQRSEEAVALAGGIREQALANEPAMTEKVSSIVSDNGGEMDGLEYRVKGTESIARKIDADAEHKGISREQSAAEVSDAVRYTAVFDEGAYTDGAESLINDLEADGFEVKAKNFWERGDDYNGMNIKATKNGTTMELQVHTKATKSAKDRTHDLYKRKSDPSLPKAERWEAWNAMVDIADSAPLPANAEKLLGLGVKSFHTPDID